MWRLLWSASGSRQALGLLEQLPQVTELRSCSAATATLQHLLAHPQMASLHGVVSNCHPTQAVTCSGCRLYSSSELNNAASSSDSTSQAQQQQQQQQDHTTLHTASPAHKQPAAAAGRHRQLAHVEQSGFVTLPPHATASGYQESFVQASQPSSSSSSSRGAAAGQPAQLPVHDVQLPQERLRIQLRQEVQQEEVQDEVDVYSLSRSLMAHENFSFEASASAAAADSDDFAAPQQQQQLSASDRQLLEKLVGIMTKDGKKSRARRLLLDAMHIIKQQVAKGQQAA